MQPSNGTSMFDLFSKGDPVKSKLTNLKLPNIGNQSSFQILEVRLLIRRRDCDKIIQKDCGSSSDASTLTRNTPESDSETSLGKPSAQKFPRFSHCLVHRDQDSLSSSIKIAYQCLVHRDRECLCTCIDPNISKTIKDQVHVFWLSQR